MAEDERRPSGCGLMVLYNGLFRRRQTPSPRRSSSAGSVSSATTTSSLNPKHRFGTSSDESALVVSGVGLADPHNGTNNNNQQLPVVPVRPVYPKAVQTPNYHQYNRPNGQRNPVEPPRGISGELDSVIYDHQRQKGSSTLVRASSSNVMLFGDLGNIRGGKSDRNVLDYLPQTAKERSTTRQGNVNGNVLDYLPQTAKERNTGRGNGQPPMPPPSLCRALSKRLEPEELKEMGNEEYKNGRFAEALALYDRAIILDPKRASYWSNKAAALTGLGRFLEAVAECKEAVKIDPSYKRAHHRLAGLYLRLGEAEKALHHYKLAGNEASSKDFSQAQNLQSHLHKCHEARKQKDWNTALKEAEISIASGASSAPQVFAAQAEALLKLQRHQEADTILIDSPTFEIDESTKFFGATGNSYILSVRAQIDMSAGRFDEAVSMSQMAARVDPSSKEAAAVVRRTRAVASARSKGNELFKLSKFTEACLAYGQGLEYDSHNSVLLCNRAACQIKLGQREKAVDDCTKALKLRPNYSKARLRRADCYIKMEKWEEALRDYEVLVEELPGDEEVEKSLTEVKIKLQKQKGENGCDSEVETGVVSISTDDQFMRITESTGASVVLLYDKSSETKQMTPFMEQLHRRYPSINFAKVDTEDNSHLAELEGFHSSPAFWIYKNGTRIKEIEGFDWDMLEKSIKSLNA